MVKCMHGDDALTQMLLDNREMPLTVGGGPEVKRERTRQMTWGGSQTHDFVWAVRLAKITKNGLQSDWKMETVVKKTSFRGQKAIF